MLYFVFFALYLVSTTVMPPKRALYGVSCLRTQSGVLSTYKAADKYNAPEEP